MEKIRTLVLERLGLRPDMPCHVSFDSRTAFKKVYKIVIPEEIEVEGWLEEQKEKIYHLSVRYPLQEKHETLSEVATMKFARKSGVPAPRVVASDADRRNSLGFEWVLMRMPGGQNLKTEWPNLSVNQKDKVVRSIAKYQARLFATKFDDIGNLFDAHDTAGYLPDFRYGDFNFTYQVSRNIRPFVGRMISIASFCDKDSYCHFTDSSSYLETLLIPVWKEISTTLRTSTCEEEMIEAQNLQTLIRKIYVKIFEICPEDTVSTVLVHDDLSMRNIFIDGSGDVTGISGWENAAVMPRWKAIQFPQFLSDDNTKKSDTEETKKLNSSVAELVKLRRLYDCEMMRRVAAWKEEIHEGKIKRDLELACKFCSIEHCVEEIGKWIDALDTNVPTALLKQ